MNCLLGNILPTVLSTSNDSLLGEGLRALERKQLPLRHDFDACIDTVSNNLNIICEQVEHFPQSIVLLVEKLGFVLRRILQKCDGVANLRRDIVPKLGVDVAQLRKRLQTLFHV